MPCQSYDTNWAHDYSHDDKVRKLKAEADKLARTACKALTALEELEQEDFILLKDDETREWWTAHKEADRKERERQAAKARKEQIRKEALARLSDEEKEALGLAKPKKRSKVGGSSNLLEDEDYLIDLLKSMSIRGMK